MKLIVKQNLTSKKLRVYVQDSTSTTGAGLTGLTSASSGLTWSYFREGDTATTSVTLVTGTLGTYSSGGFKEVDATNMPGVYEVGVPNAVFNNLGSAQMMLRGATNMVPRPVEFEVIAADLEDSVRAGLTALPNAAPATSGGLPACNANVTGYGWTLAVDVESVYADTAKAQALYNHLGTLDSSGRLGFATITPDLLTGLGSAYLVTTGTTSPITADSQWYVGGYNAGVRYYRSKTLALYAWTDGTAWYITSTTPGASLPAGYWKTANGASVTGPYTAQGTATGTPTVTAHGNAVLNTFQPDVGFPANFSLLSIDGTGRVKSLDSTGTAFTYVTPPTPPTAAAIATAVLTDTTSSDLAAAGSLGHLVTTAPSWYSTSVTVSDKTGFSLTSAYDPAKTAAQAGNAMTLTPGERSTLATSFLTDTTALDLATNGSLGYLIGHSPTWYTAPDNADVVTALADLVTLLARTDPTSNIAAIKAKTDNLPASPAAVGSAMTLTSGERDAIAGDILDLANGVETSLTVRQALRLFAAALLGKASGAATTTVTFRDTADTKARITATVDASGNRTAVALDAT